MERFGVTGRKKGEDGERERVLAPAAIALVWAIIKQCSGLYFVCMEGVHQEDMDLPTKLLTVHCPTDVSHE